MNDCRQRTDKIHPTKRSWEVEDVLRRSRLPPPCCGEHDAVFSKRRCTLHCRDYGVSLPVRPVRLYLRNTAILRRRYSITSSQSSRFECHPEPPILISLCRCSKVPNNVDEPCYNLSLTNTHCIKMSAHSQGKLISCLLPAVVGIHRRNLARNIGGAPQPRAASIFQPSRRLFSKPPQLPLFSSSGDNFWRVHAFPCCVGKDEVSVRIGL
jgi:hypothetical protein